MPVQKELPEQAILKYNYRLMASNLLTNYPKRLEETDKLEIAMFLLFIKI